MNLNVSDLTKAVVSFAILALIVVGVGIPILASSANDIEGDAELNEGATVFYSDAPATLSFATNKTYSVNGATQAVTDAVVLSDVAYATMLVGGNTSGVMHFADGTTALIRSMKIGNGVLSYATTAAPSTYVDLPCNFAIYSVAANGNYAEYGSAGSNTYKNAYTYGTSGGNYAVAKVGTTNKIVLTNTDATEITVQGYSVDDAVITWDNVGFGFTGDTANLTSSKVIVEVEYHDNPDGINASTKALITIVPLLILVGLVIAAVRQFIARE